MNLKINFKFPLSQKKYYTIIMKILIVEDEKMLANSISKILEKKNFETDVVFNGDDGLDFALLDIYDLIILDVMMPGIDGYEVASRIRKNHLSVPILMLTAKSSTENRIEGLNCGADYYLTKPFDTRELMACINALLRRQGNEIDEIRFGNTILDLATATLICNDINIRLSAKEFELMRHLMVSKEKNISKDALLTRVWGYDSEATENNVEVYIGFLRKKLKQINSDITIESIRKLGYHLEVI